MRAIYGQMQVTNHILAKEGILTNFSIAKKVTARDVKKIRDKMKSAKVDAGKLQELLRQAIVQETQKSMETQTIPGLIVNINNTFEEEKQRIMELTYFASLIAKKLAEKKVGKYHSCYIINAIVNMLGLTEEDFDEFHRKFARFRNGDSPSEDSAE